MFPFEDEPTCSDDLAVLAAYAAEEDAAKARLESEAPFANHPSANHTANQSVPGDEDKDDTESSSPPRQVWVRRLREVDGIAGEKLAPIHGRLIAHGLLQFQLQGQNEGVVYRLTSAGRKQLASRSEPEFSATVADIDSPSPQESAAA